MREILRGAARLTAPTKKIDILIDSGTIQAIATAGTIEGAPVRDLDGLLIMPGAIDPHVHPVHAESFASVGNAAVYGGVTTVCHQVYPDPGEAYRDAMRRMASESNDGVADFVGHLRWDRTRATRDVIEGAAAGAASIKVFLAHPDKTVQASLAELVLAMQAAREAGLVCLLHAEVGELVDEFSSLGYGSVQSLAELNDWRSPDLEGIAVELAALAARTVDAQLYVVHTSCGAALSAAHAARMAGARIYVETCPHYAFLNLHTGPPGGFGFVLPPLRNEADQEAVRAGMVNGLVDTVGSDHCGHKSTDKQPDIGRSKAGLPGLETTLPLMLDAVLGTDAWLSANRLVELLCKGPARCFRLAKKGTLAPGFDADLVAVDPRGSTLIQSASLHSAVTYTPYESWRLAGAIEFVWRRGELVVSQNQLARHGGGRQVIKDVAL